MCRYYDNTRTAYYKHIANKAKRQQCEEDVLRMVKEERHLQPRLGCKKLYFILEDRIHAKAPHIGRDKFFDLLRDNGLLVRRKRSGTRTTDSHHHFHTYKNVLKDVEITSSNQAWVADITYLRSTHKFVYLSLLTDRYSRKIVGWHLSSSLNIEGSLEALKGAIRAERPSEGVIHHSDRGIQYCSAAYTGLLLEEHARISMTEENHCYENGMAERVNGILKSEYGLDATFVDEAHARRACEQAIAMYNMRRPHWALGLKTPQQVHSAAQRSLAGTRQRTLATLPSTNLSLKRNELVKSSNNLSTFFRT
jgi:transposase InsO family protein